MIRPCDQCDGTGTWERQYLPACDCPRCADMPNLFPGYLSEHEREVMRRAGADAWDDSLDPNVHTAWMQGGFKPDPDTVMRWCFTHGGTVTLYPHMCDPTCFAVEKTQSYDDLAPCDLGWVERPTRLEEGE